MNKARSLKMSIDCGKGKVVHEQIRFERSGKKEKLKEELKDQIIETLSGDKTIVRGRDLATYLTEIPKAYSAAINKAVELAKNAD
jgi:hypothetical protein